ncbi:MAG: FHA domain-containing protein [Acidobacteria bacterium]|nr:FHA domain-containing protein [Acidobacteriota bacterium]
MKTFLTVFLPDKTQKDIEIMPNITIGQASDNCIVIKHPSISPYQAILEKRHQSYYLTNLSKNIPILVNGVAIYGEKKLKPEDKIEIGASKFIFHQEGQRILPKSTFEKPNLEVAKEPNQELKSDFITAEKSPKSKPSILLVLSAIALGLIITFASIFLVFYPEPQKPTNLVHIVSPASGSVIRASTSILLEVKDTKNIDTLIYQLDGVEIARCESPPYKLVIEPAKLATKFPSLTTSNHILSITLEDTKGKKTLQSESLLLAFEMAEIATATSTPAIDSSNYDRNISSTPRVDISVMTTNLVAQIAQKSGYNLRPGFVEKIRLSTNNYCINTINNARRNRREIIKAFRDKGLHPLLGFVLATSESKFQPSNNNSKVGLWQIPKEIGKNYLLPGEQETMLNDPKRGAEIAAAYLKDLINVFGIDNFVYAIACYGQTVGEAGELRTKLATSDLATTWQNDFWYTVEKGLISQDAAKHVVNFFAAGIVGENPQAFALQQERLSSLY